MLKAQPDGAGALNKTDPCPSASPGAAGAPRFMRSPAMLALLEPSPFSSRRPGWPSVAVTSRVAAPETNLSMDRAYESSKVCPLALDVGYVPTVPSLWRGSDPRCNGRETYWKRMDYRDISLFRFQSKLARTSASEGLLIVPWVMRLAP